MSDYKPNDIFDNIEERKDRKKYLVSLRYGFHDSFIVLLEFIIGKRVPKDEYYFEQEFINQAIKNPQASADFLKNQKIVNDTLARRRLEKWVTRVIVTYLIIVAALLTANGIANLYDKRLFSDTILITILSTTTVNIIGLGIIVLKGHFGVDSHNYPPNP